MKIGIFSDTHGWLDPKLDEYFKVCDELWHAGDIGAIDLEAFAGSKKLRAVYGNIDGGKNRQTFPEYQFFEVEGLRILLIHIAGSLGKYNSQTRKLILEHKPQILVCGHSHILKVQRDKAFGNLLYINPGAAGVHGFHKIKTILRMEIKEGKILAAEAIELGLRGR